MKKELTCLFTGASWLIRGEFPEPARTERLPQRVRTVAGAVVVLSAYGCWSLVSGGVGSFLSILAISAGGPWATACVVWFAGVASWNLYLFRPPRYHGSNN